MQLSLDCLTLTDTAPPDVIRAAADAGFELVSMWVQPPPIYPAAQFLPAQLWECRSLLADTGVSLHSLEVFDLVSEDALESYRPALEAGAQLGGKAPLTYQLTNPDQSYAADILGRFAEIAAEYGLATNVDLWPWGNARLCDRLATSSPSPVRMWASWPISGTSSGRAGRLRT